jgi:uncharacterized membrane protein YqjE
MTTPPTTLASLVDLLLRYVNALIPFLLAVVFVVVVWKLVTAWVIHADDPEKQKEGRMVALVAVLVFVVMAIAWGLVELVRSSLFQSGS